MRSFYVFAMVALVWACSWFRSPQGAADASLAAKDVLCIIEHADESPVQIVKDCSIANDLIDVVGQIADKHKATSPHCAEVKGKSAMGQWRIEIEAFGGAHCCQQETKEGELKPFCGDSSCIRCRAHAFVDTLKAEGLEIRGAKMAHWEGSASKTVDDLVTGTRGGPWGEIAPVLAVPPPPADTPPPNTKPEGKSEG